MKPLNFVSKPLETMADISKKRISNAISQQAFLYLE